MMAHGDNDLAIGDRVTARFAPFAGRLVPYFEKAKIMSRRSKREAAKSTRSCAGAAMTARAEQSSTGSILMVRIASPRTLLAR